MQAATWKQIFNLQTHLPPQGCGQNVRHFSSESSHVAYQFKGMEQSKHPVLTHALDPWDRSKGQIINFFKDGHVTYLNGKRLMQHHGIP